MLSALKESLRPTPTHPLTGLHGHLCLTLAKDDIANALAPTEFLALVLSCMEPLTFPVEVTRSHRPDERLTALATVLERGLPSLPLRTALTVARLADSYMRESAIVSDGQGFCMDVASHLRLSSSSGHKGRLLTAVVTLFQPSRILEIGTAYGLSTTFLAEASTAPVTTVETWEPMKTLSSSRLGQRYAGRVSCVHVPVQQHARASFPMVFHDADHCAEAYIADFAAVEPSMPSGAVLVLDDINVRDSNAGWQRILAHPRVQHAIEVDGNIGVAVLA